MSVVRLSPAQLTALIYLDSEIAGDPISLHTPVRGGLVVIVTTNPESREEFRREWLLDVNGEICVGEGTEWVER